MVYIFVLVWFKNKNSKKTKCCGNCVFCDMNRECEDANFDNW